MNQFFVKISLLNRIINLIINSPHESDIKYHIAREYPDAYIIDILPIHNTETVRDTLTAI